MRGNNAPSMMAARWTDCNSGPICLICWHWRDRYKYCTHIYYKNINHLFNPVYTSVYSIFVLITHYYCCYCYHCLCCTISLLYF